MNEYQRWSYTPGGFQTPEEAAATPVHVEHPLYSDEEIVARETARHIAQGRSVFQLFQLDPDERLHSLKVLALAGLEANAHVVSLGCGVAGMEHYWQQARPDLQFTLVNNSACQLELSKQFCAGMRWHADAQDFVPMGPADCTVLAYMLGHVDAEATLRNAIANTRKTGSVIVLDVFDADRRFEQQMAYYPPGLDLMLCLGFEPLFGDSLKLVPWLQAEAPWINDAVHPAMFKRKGECL